MVCTFFNTFVHGALDLKIEGVSNAAIRDNIRVLVGASDILQQNQLNPFWQKQLRDTLEKALAPYGYYHSQHSAEISKNTLLLTVSLGKPIRIDTINKTLTGDGENDSAFVALFNAYPQKQGDPLNQPAYGKYKTDIFNYALSHGFFDFTWKTTSIDITRDKHAATLTLTATTGPQYLFGDIRIKGDNKSLALLERIKPFNTGDKYRVDQLTEFNRTLNDTGYFQVVIARPIVKEAQNNYVPIDITLVHRPEDSFNVGVGVSTDTGGRVSFNWDHPWASSRGASISSEMFLSEREQEVRGQYKLPLKNITSDYATFDIGYSFLDDDDQSTNSETLTLSASRYWRKPTLPWQFGTSLTFLRENFRQALSEPITTQLLLSGFSANYLNAKGDLGNRTGFKIDNSIEVGSEAIVSDIDIAKVLVDSQWIKSFGKHRLYLRGQLGAIATSDFNAVPSSLRFFTGGDQTIRGFEFQTISSGVTVPTPTEDNPEQTDFLPQGGRFLATASIEYAYPISEKWRAAVFVDAGTATNNFAGEWAGSTGIGAHWLTLIGPVRFYIAVGRNEIDPDTSFRFHFLLGPEL